jgi:hypothetical protein
MTPILSLLSYLSDIFCKEGFRTNKKVHDEIWIPSAATTVASNIPRSTHYVVK